MNDTIIIGGKKYPVTDSYENLRHYVEAYQGKKFENTAQAHDMVLDLAFRALIDPKPFRDITTMRSAMSASEYRAIDRVIISIVMGLNSDEKAALDAALERMDGDSQAELPGK